MPHANKKRWFGILTVVALIAFCLFTFPPKRSVVGGIGGFWGPGKTVYREDYGCIGLNIGLPPLGVIADGDLTYWCFGNLTNRVCTIESVTQDSKIIRTPVACRDEMHGRGGAGRWFENETKLLFGANS